MARKMKDSGIEWIGEIPEGWETIKLKNIASIVRGGSPRPIEAYMSDNDNDVNWIRISDTEKGSKYITHACRKLISSGISKSRFIKRGSLILTNSMSFGEPYILAIDGCIHDGWVAFSDFTKIDKEFLYYFLVSPLAKLQFEQQVDGGVVKNLNIDKIGDTIILLPPYNEQNKIIAYLDCFTSNIDLLLSKTISSVEEYKKLKQAVITQAVTKGVRGKREMKDSGVEWIGEIPKEWDILNLVAHTSMLTPMRDRPENLDGPIPWIRIEDFDGKYISSSKASLGVSKETVQSMNLKIYPVGTILCTSSCIMGKCAIVSRELVSNQRFIGIIPDQNTCENFLYYLMLSNSERMNYLATGALQANLSRSSFEHLKVQFPSYQEQKEIADYLDAKCAEIDGLIAKKEQLVKELESYKKSLIYEVVTGKREV